MSIKSEYIITTEAAEMGFQLSNDSSNRINDFDFVGTYATGKSLRLKNGVTPYEIPAFNFNSRLIITAARVEIIGASGLRPYAKSSSSVNVPYPIRLQVSRLNTNQGSTYEEQMLFLHNFNEWEEQGKEFFPLPAIGFNYGIRLTRLKFEYDSLAMQDIFRGQNAYAVAMFKIKCAGISSEL